MRRTILLLTAGLTAATFATSGTSWGAEGCSPVPCTVSGVLEGSNIVPDPTFEWALRFNGAERFNGYLYRQPPARLVGTAARVPLTPSAYVPILYREVPSRYGYRVSGYLEVGYGQHRVWVSGILSSEDGMVSGTLHGATGRASVTTLTISAGQLVGAVSSTRGSTTLPIIPGHDTWVPLPR